MAKKRANGEGNIRKRKDGRWEGRYTAGYDPKTGKRIIKNVLGKTQGEVKEKLKTAIAESQGLDVSKAADEYTVATWLRTWYELYAKPNVRTATANRYELIIETYTIPRIGNIKLKKLTTRHLQKLYKEFIGGGQNTCWKDAGKRAEHHYRPQRPPDAPCGLGTGGQGAVDTQKSHRGLYCPEAKKNRDADSAR